MTWDGIRGTFQWMLVLLLISIVTVGGAAFHFWSQKDAFVYQTVESQLTELFPSCDVSFSEVQISDASHFSITDLYLRLKDSGATLLQIPRLTIVIDGKLFRARRKVILKRVEVDSPKLFVLRDERGNWNFGKLEMRKSKQNYSPNFVVKNGQVQIGIRSLAGGPLHTITSSYLNLKCLPEANKRYQISGDSTVESMGNVSLQGLFDLNNGEWNIAGRAGQIRMDDPLLEQAGAFVPEIEERLAELKRSPHFMGNNRLPVKTVSTKSQEVVTDPTTHETESLLRADIDLSFSVGQTQKDARLDYLVTTKIAHGHISDLFLPIPLYDVSAYLELTPDKISVDKFQATNNQSSLFIDGEAKRTENDWSRDFVVKATNLQIDERIQSLLPEELLKVYRLINPSGTFDLDFDIIQKAGETWSGNLRTFTARNCRVVVDHFRYPVEQIQGQVTHQDDRFRLQMNGVAAQQPVSIQGYFGGGLSRKDFDLKVTTNNFPVDDRFTEALARKDLEGAKNTLQSLRLSGVTDLDVRILRTPQTQNEIKLKLSADVRDSSLNFVNFPYQLEGFSGRLDFDNTLENVWKFSDLKGRHGHSILTGRGAFDRTASPGMLTLEIGVIRIPIDSDLKKASLTAMPELESLWADFELAGTLDVEKVAIAWQPGSRTQLTMDGIQWKDGKIKPAAFPYQWNDVVASLQWTGERLNIHSLNGWHDETYLEIKGTDPEWPTFVSIPEEGPVAWETHFGNMMIVKAKFDENLHRALPVSLAETFKAMDLQGHVDIQLRADIRGWEQDKDAVTANWELQSALENNSLFAGVQLDGVTGKVKIRDGVWDGQNLRMEGALDLEEATALGLPLKKIRSSFHLDRSRLIIGAPKFLEQSPPFRKPNEYAGKQLRADLYDGQIGYDALVLLGPRPELTQYKAELNVNDIELAEVAADQSPGTKRLKGKVNGIMAFQGIGPSPESVQGKGWVNITPAAIMDLPAFAQMFALINFRPVGNTAFNYAFGEFILNKGRFEFSQIELRGDALGLIGKGIVGFAAGKQSLINLTFDSRTNNQLPVVGRIIDGIGSSWIRVQVTGTVEQPIPMIQPRIAPLDDAFREFTDAMEKGQNMRSPLRLRDARRKLGL